MRDAIALPSDTAELRACIFFFLFPGGGQQLHDGTMIRIFVTITKEDTC